MVSTYRSHGHRYWRPEDELRAELYRGKPQTPVIRSRKLKVYDAIEIAHLRLLPGEVETMPMRGHLVNLHLSSSPHYLIQRRNERTHEGTKNPGVVDIIPTDTPALWSMDAASEHACMLIEDRFLRRVAVEAGVNLDGFEVVPRFSTQDAQIEVLGLSLLSEMKSDGLGGKLYSESLANLLALHLLREHSSLGRGSRRKLEHQNEREYGLSRRSLSEVNDYINDNLRRKLTLQELAGVVHMSPHYFARSFKATTGTSPHQYVVSRRVERARSLLANSSLTITEVAIAVGFSSQSHLASHVRRVLGVSPGDLRRQGLP